jgi:hypothetical protein
MRTSVECPHGIALHHANDIDNNVDNRDARMIEWNSTLGIYQLKFPRSNNLIA